MKRALVALAASVFALSIAVSCASTKPVAEPAQAAAPAKSNLPMLTADSELVLKAFKAKLKNGGGEGIRLEDGGNVGYWSSTGDVVSWPFEVAEAGDYKVAVEYSLDPQFTGAVVKVAVGDKSLEWTVDTTGSWGTYKTLDLGTLSLEAGAQTLSLQATSIKVRFVANLKSVTLSK